MQNDSTVYAERLQRPLSIRSGSAGVKSTC